MYKQVIKKYSIIVFYFLLSSPCLAKASQTEFTHDIVSHTMLSYLKDVHAQKVKILQSQYDEYASLFKQNREEEIEKKLKEKLAELNQFSIVLKRKAAKLNKEIALYNQLLIQHKKKIKKTSDIQNQLDKAIQRFNKVNESKKKVLSLFEKINEEVGILNKYMHELNTLRKAAQAALLFYKNKKYLSHKSIVEFKQSLIEWNTNKDEELKSKVTAYNNKVEAFEKWQQDQQEAIGEQRNQVNLKVAELNQFVEEINALIVEYNQEREKKCKTKQCEKDLLNKRNQIEEKKEENKNRQIVVDQLILNINQKEKDYNTEHANRSKALGTLKEEIKTFSQLFSTELAQKEKELAERIQKQSEEAKQKMEKAQEVLDQLQTLLNTNYGDHFNQFVENFSQWLNVNRTLLNSVRTQSLSQPQMEKMKANNDILCEYSSQYPLAVKAKAVCNFITQIHMLLGEIYNSYSDVSPEVWVKQLDEVKKEITALEKRIAAKKHVNEQQKSQLEAQVKKYNSQLPEREAQYKLFSKQLTAELNKQFQQIHRAYRLKSTLLEKEYDLLSSVLSQDDLKEKGKSIDEKRDAFSLALRQFISSLPKEIPHFFLNFAQSNEIIFTVLEQSGWQMDSYQVIQLSTVSNTQDNRVRQMEEEEKRRIVFSWMKTPFISHFLIFLRDRFSGVFNVKDENGIGVDGERMFIEMLFLKSVYRFISVHQITENSLIRYQIIFDDRVFWILPEGKLRWLEGTYQ